MRLRTRLCLRGSTPNMSGSISAETRMLRCFPGGKLTVVGSHRSSVVAPAVAPETSTRRVTNVTPSCIRRSNGDEPQYIVGDDLVADGEAVRRHPRPKRWYPPPRRQVEHLRPPSQTIVGPLADLDRPEGSKLGGVRVAPATRAGAELGWAAGRTKPLGKPYSTSVECRETPANVNFGGLVEHMFRSQRPPAATGTVFAAGSSPSTLWATIWSLTARLCDAILGQSGGIHRHAGRSTSAPPSQTIVGPLADLDRPEGSKLGGVRVAPATRAGAELGWAAGRTKPLGKPYSTSVECRETP